MEIINLLLRGINVIFITIVLGTSGWLVHDQLAGNSSINDYTVFVGTWGMLVTLIGIVAGFASFLQGPVMLILDGLSALFFVAGGIALAAYLRARSCSPISPGVPQYWQYNNDVVDGGARVHLQDGENYFRYYDYSTRCRVANAETAFMWFAFAIFVGNIIADFMGFGRRK